MDPSLGAALQKETLKMSSGKIVWTFQNNLRSSSSGNSALQLNCRVANTTKRQTLSNL